MNKNNKIEFPKWEGYKNLEGAKQLISRGCFNNDKIILEHAARLAIENIYFRNLLRYVQHRLDRHIFMKEPLRLCINSSFEIFEGIMIAPCEDIDIKDKKIIGVL